ncbi:MAG: hypothetical protein K0Q63_2757 [Paenibacillus sp.]|jgi:two-component system response regulator YesN|nr:hypothetical protein [Paenibacillus sp.]
MLKVVVVDDEILVRVGLKTFVPWSEHGFRLVGEAANGREALELIRREGCEILLTDIQMPEMDGLTLLENIRAEQLEMHIIIMSNHEEFNYVRKALQLGAADYLLKLTMEPQELEQKLLALRDKIMQERKLQSREREMRREISANSREAREKRFRDILVKSCSPAEIRECMSAYGYNDNSWTYHVACIRIARYEQVMADNRYKSEKLLAYSVSNILMEILKSRAQGELVELDNGRFALLSVVPPDDMLNEMAESVKLYLDLDLVIGLSEPCADVRSIQVARERAELALDAAFYDGVGGVYAYSQVAHWEQADNAPLIVPIEKFARLIALRDERGLQEAMREWAAAIGNRRCWSPERVKESWIQLVHSFSSSLPDPEGDVYSFPPYRDQYPYHAIRTAETLDDLQEWLTGWIPALIDCLKTRSQRRWRPEVQTVAELIRANFDTTLKVSNLARQVGFNEAYLSALFKKETGETIMDFTIRLRMGKARELLKQPGVKIYEVSEAIGYSDANYFTKLFKKMEGLHPQDYRKRYFGK